jgi:hypothetical protein
MVEMPSIVIFIICLIGCGIQSFFLGRRVGVEHTLVYLENEGLIEFEENIDE